MALRGGVLRTMSSALTEAATFAACYRAACAAMAGHEPELIRFAAGEIYRKAQAIA
jgi:hypothetical protein